MQILLVNESTVITSHHHSMSQLGCVLPQLIETVTAAPLDGGNIVFSKLDINDGYWRMVVKKGNHLNFAYVLLDVKDARITLVTSSALQMGWMEPSPFFCAATETARDVTEDLAKEKQDSLPKHPRDT